jgi:hypothetical protein
MKRAAQFFRLIDGHDGQLSITNVAVLVVLIKIALASEVSLTDAGALFVVLMSYQSKKVINKDRAINASTLAEAGNNAGIALELAGDLVKRVDELASKVTQQQMSMGIRDLGKR